MELKQFVKNVLKEVVDAVEEARSESSRNMYLDTGKDARTIEFDIAVTVEDSVQGSGKGGIKVLQIIEGSTEVSKEIKNSSVSRIKFAVYVDSNTKEEVMRMNAETARLQHEF